MASSLSPVWKKPRREEKSGKLLMDPTRPCLQAVLLCLVYSFSVDSKAEMKRQNLRTAVTWLIRKSGPERKVGVPEKANTRSQNAYHNPRNHSISI